MDMLVSIWTYPVKSLGPVVHGSARLEEGEGLAGDRAWGIVSSEKSIAADGEWTACQAFRRLTIDPEMNGWTLRHQDGEVVIETKRGTVTLPVGDAGEVIFKEELGAGVRFVRARRGWWDHRDGALSIINLSTLEEIERTTGLPMPAERFRANLYIVAPAWSEFDMVGRRISIGDALLDVIRPIDRCRATSLLPGATRPDGNVPALLMRHFGHIFCGVYAQVVRSGRIAARNAIIPAGIALPGTTSVAASTETAPAMASWPRVADVTEVVTENSDTRSVWLRDPLAAEGALASYRAGQHLRVHLASDPGTWRCYTVSAIDTDLLRLTVRRGANAGSTAMHRLAVGDRLLISGPLGDFTVPPGRRPLFLVSAGIGVTPMIAALRDGRTAGRPLHCIHVVRDRADAPMLRELEEGVTAVGGTLRVFATGGDIAARPDWCRLADKVVQDGGSVMICGPAGFTQDVATALKGAGVQAADIRYETFTTPTLNAELRPPASAGPCQVTFVLDGSVASWTARDGTLLDLAEARGYTPPSHCRAGVCGACRVELLGGFAEVLVGDGGIVAHSALACCSVPSGDVTIAWPA